MAKFSDMDGTKVCSVIETAILDAYGQNLKKKMMEFAEAEIDEVVRETMRKLDVRSEFFQSFMGPGFQLSTVVNGEKVEQQ